MQRIHPTALVDERAQIGNDVEIGPFSVVGPDVIVGDRCILKSHVTLKAQQQWAQTTSSTLTLTSACSPRFKI